MHQLAFLTFLSLSASGNLVHAAPTWHSNSFSIQTRHARLFSSHKGGRLYDSNQLSSANNTHDSTGLKDTSSGGGQKDSDPKFLPVVARVVATMAAAQASPAVVKRDENTSYFPQNLYGEFFDGLEESWGSTTADGNSIQQVLDPPESSTAASSFPTPAAGTHATLGHLPYMGPGIELAPPPATPFTTAGHPYASGLHKLIAVLTVVAAIGLIMLGCFLINERHLLWCFFCKKRKGSQGSGKAKRKRLWAEKGVADWRTKYLSPSPARSNYLSPPSPTPSDLSSECSESSSSNGNRSSNIPEDRVIDISPAADFPKSKWSMTISDYGISPRTSASTNAHRSVPESIQQPYPPILVSPPQVYNSFLPSLGRNSSDSSDFPFHPCHVRNQSAPVTPSIASSASDGNIDGRSRSSSTSSVRVARVLWK